MARIPQIVSMRRVSFLCLPAPGRRAFSLLPAMMLDPRRDCIHPQPTRTLRRLLPPPPRSERHPPGVLTRDSTIGHVPLQLTNPLQVPREEHPHGDAFPDLRESQPRYPPNSAAACRVFPERKPAYSFSDSCTKGASCPQPSSPQDAFLTLSACNWCSRSRN